MTGSIEGSSPVGRVWLRAATADETRRANQAWWNGAADDYQAEHGAFLGDARLVWGPEGLDETDVQLLGEPAGQQILEIGCGAGNGSRWLLTQGARPLGIDLSHRQLQHSLRIDEDTNLHVPVVCSDAARLPLADDTFDSAFSAYGALPFVASADAVLAEVARVIRPHGRFVFSVTHPVRWAFRDDPGPAGLVAERPYFDRQAYVETDDAGTPSYVEHHRTLGDWVRLIHASGFDLVDLVEPAWPDGLEQAWGGWSPLRGRLLPGTAIFCCRR